MPEMKTIDISGMLVKKPRRGMPKGDYTDVDLVYNVEPSVSIDDIIYYLENYSGGLRVVPAKTDGSKLEYVVGVDRNRIGPGPVLNRVGFSRQLKKDLDSLAWNKDTSWKK